MSQVVSTERLQVGMVLGDDLSTQSGQLIARKGQEVTPRLIPLMRSFGITEAAITNPPEEEHPVSPSELKEAAMELEGWFQTTNRQDPMIEELFRLCVARKARQNRGHPTHQKV